MEDFLKEMIVESTQDDNYDAHQVGRIVVYSGRDGLKYYVIIEREETPLVQHQHDWWKQYRPHVDSSKFMNVSVTLSMISNPTLDVGYRAAKRDMSACGCKVLDTDNWMEIQDRFIATMMDVAQRRVAGKK